MVEIIDPDGNVTRYLYDLAGNKVATIDPLGHASYTAYNQDNQPVKSVDRDGRTTENNYDPAGRLISQVWLNADGSQQNDLTYSYDAAGNQLTSAGNSNYSYDLNGNRNMTGYVDGAGNELQSDGVWNFRYDPEGNLIEKDGISNGLIWKYTWDDAHHLLTATEYNASTGAVEEQETNFWDVFGNLIEQDQFNASTGTTTVTKFANQIVGLSPGQQGTGGTAPVWADLNGSDQIETRRVYLNAIDAVFARIGSDGSEAWYLSDHLGSIRGLMNNSGTLIDTLAYDAYGNITGESSPANGDRYKFDGGQYDSMTGLELFGERWYSPVDGIWVSQDPLGLLPDSNPYRYVGNDPTGAVDLLGEQELLFTMVSGYRGIGEYARAQWGFTIRFGVDYNNDNTVKDGYAWITRSKDRAVHIGARYKDGTISISRSYEILVSTTPPKVEDGKKVLVEKVGFIVIKKVITKQSTRANAPKSQVIAN